MRLTVTVANFNFIAMVAYSRGNQHLSPEPLICVGVFVGITVAATVLACSCVPVACRFRTVTDYTVSGKSLINFENIANCQCREICAARQFRPQRPKTALIFGANGALTTTVWK